MSNLPNYSKDWWWRDYIFKQHFNSHEYSKELARYLKPRKRENMTTKIDDLKKYLITYPNRETLFDTYEDALNAAKRKTQRDHDGDIWGVYTCVAYPEPVTPDLKIVTLIPN